MAGNDGTDNFTSSHKDTKCVSVVGSMIKFQEVKI